MHQVGQRESAKERVGIRHGNVLDFDMKKKDDLEELLRIRLGIEKSKRRVRIMIATFFSGCFVIWLIFKILRI